MHFEFAQISFLLTQQARIEDINTDRFDDSLRRKLLEGPGGMPPWERFRF